MLNWEYVMAAHFGRHTWIIVTVLAITALAVEGCYSKIKGQSEVSFKNPAFSETALKSRGLAVFPVIILEDSLKKAAEPHGEIPSAPYAEGTPSGGTKDKQHIITHDAYRIILSELLMSKIQARRPSLKIVSPGDALKRLNDAGLTEAYRQFNNDFPKVGFDSEILAKFGKILECRYLLISQAVVTESKTDASLIIVWTFGRKSTLRTVKISGQIWDTCKGEQMWEGLGIGYNRLSAYESTPLLEEVAVKAVISLLQSIMP